MKALESKVRITSDINSFTAKSEVITYPGTQIDFEYFDKSERVKVWKEGFNSALGIQNPRWDAARIFTPGRFGKYSPHSGLNISEDGILSSTSVPTFVPSSNEESLVFTDTYMAEKFDTTTSNGSHMPEYFSDITDIFTNAVREGKRLGLEVNGEEVQEALIDFAVKATLRLENALPDEPFLRERMRQFAINTQQRIQLEILRSQSREYDITRQFDKELKRAENSSSAKISSDNFEFMRLNYVGKWENITMSMIEEKLSPMNNASFEKIRSAVLIAKEYHKDQTHLGLSPYMVHIFRVMVRILEDPALSEDKEILGTALSIAALHDVLEDTDLSEDKLGELVNDEVLNGVIALSKWKNTDGVPEDFDPDEYYENLYRRPAYERYVKGYDRVDNWEASHQKVNKEIEDKKEAIRAQEEYYEETQRYYPLLISDNHKLLTDLEKAVNKQEKDILIFVQA